MKNLLVKLLALQAKIKPILKAEENPYYSSSYFDINGVIADVKPALCEIGLVVLQPLTTLDGKNAIETIIADPESGEMISKTMLLAEGSDIQKTGGNVTYQRRFALTSFLLLQGEEDDDGNKSAAKAKKPIQPKTNPASVVYETTNPHDIDSLVAGSTCPSCYEGHMKLRKGPKGEFLGCDAYPKCKNTAQI